MHEVRPPDPRVRFTSSVQGLAAATPVFTREIDGSSRVSILIQNLSLQDVGLLARIDWYDAAGHQIPTTIRGYERFTVPREGEVAMTHTNADAKAADFRVVLDSDLQHTHAGDPVR